MARSNPENRIAELEQALSDMLEYARFLELLVPDFQDNEWNAKVDRADAALNFEG